MWLNVANNCVGAWSGTENATASCKTLLIKLQNSIHCVVSAVSPLKLGGIGFPTRCVKQATVSLKVLRVRRKL